MSEFARLGQNDRGLYVNENALKYRTLATTKKGIWECLHDLRQTNHFMVENIIQKGKENVPVYSV